MFFDLTKNVVLEPKWQRYYLVARLALWTAILSGIIYLGWVILFPTQTFFIQLSGPGSDRDTQNNFSFSISPLTFDAFSRENFSDVKIIFDQVKDKEVLNGQEIRARKSYQSFGYSTANRPAEFPSGSLLRNRANYFIVSNGLLRRFSSDKLAESLGYTDDFFSEVSTEELSYNAMGPEITDAKSYPDDSLFSIVGTYYRMRDQKLYPFVSENAFKSFFDPRQALPKDENFLSTYKVSNDIQGFSNGTLLSFDNAVFIVVDGKVLPFNHPETFLSFGFDWNDVITASEEETGLYERDKLFTIDRPLPDGTIFKTTGEGKYFLIMDGKKWPILGEAVLNAYLKKSPVLVNAKSLEFDHSCRLKEYIWPPDSFACSISISDLAGFAGNDYRIETGLPNDVNIQDVTIVFSRDITWPNMRDTLSKIKLRFLTNYGYAPIQQ